MKHGILTLNTLHILNDGYYASLILLLPFLTHDFQLDLFQAGFLGSIPGLLAIVVALPASPLSIKFGGVKILLTAALAYAFSYLFLSATVSFMTVLPIFILAGAAFGSFHPVAFALVARLVDPKKRGQEIGKFTALGDTGKVAISALVTFLAALIGWRSTSLLYGLSAGILILCVSFFLFKSRSPHQKLEKPKHLPLSVLLKNKRFLLASSAGFLDFLSSYPLFIFLPFLLLSKGVSPSILGSLVGAYLIGNLFGKAALGRLTDIFGHAKIFIIAEFFTAVFILLLTFSNGIIPIIIISIILGTLTKGTVPVTQTMVTDAVEHHGNFEKSIGFYSFVSNIAAAISTIFLGYVSDHFGIQNAFVLNSLFAFSAIIPAALFLITKPHHGNK